MDASSPSSSPLPPIPMGRIMRPTPQIPDHRIVRQIGSGAYGEVWLAQSLTGAWRAVKIVWREDFEDDRTFNREFEGIEHYEPIARNHPGLVHILHVGRKSDPDLYYYVMELGDDAQNGVHIDAAEYIPRTLQTDKKLAGGRPLPLDYCIEVGSQLSHALVYLHSKELTHRDIKPTNVIFVNGRPKLADIGLVAHRDQRSFVGTEGFIPPEGPGTKRADVYALAKVLYEISSGKDRLDFPELPDQLPPETPRKKWQNFNHIICSAAEPRVDKCSLCTAEDLSEAIDSLRGHSVHPKFKRPRKKRKISPRTKILLSAVSGGIISILSVLFLERMNLTNFLFHDPLKGDMPPVSPDESYKPPHLGEGYLFISSIPSGASIYDDSGRYVDETPYGPILLPAHKKVSYTIKKEGYSDWFETGVVQNGETLAIGGVLREYNPPVEGRYWADSEGMNYIPDGASHTSELPVTIDIFSQFLSGQNKKNQFPRESTAMSDKKDAPQIVLTSPDGITAYLAWLVKRCQNEGILDDSFTISAEAVPGFSSRNDTLHAYRLTVHKIREVPISVHTEPHGARVYINGVMIGKSPINNYSVVQAPYSIEIKLPGYATMRRSGLDPLNLYLSLQLKKDKSVIFSEPWENSMGMKLIPVSPSSMAQIHEVKRGDYMTFVKNTKRQAPSPPGFEQGERHPIVNVSREDAEAFASWLTEKERGLGMIEKTDCYRLPTDAEWSFLVGLKEEKGDSPYERSIDSAKYPAHFFWGSKWPPSPKTCNFADKSALSYLPSSRIIVNYEDGMPYTSPIGLYSPNEMGIYDLDGNVQEWVGDDFGGGPDLKFSNYAVARGGNYLSFRPNQLNKAIRTPLPPMEADPAIGFRLILMRNSDESKKSN